MSKFNDLPSEVHIEIFAFLSVKHLRKLLTINKTINDQLTNSEIFWHYLLNNYTKYKQEQAEEHKSNGDELLEISTKVKKQLLEEINLKREKMKLIEKQVEDYRWDEVETRDSVLTMCLAFHDPKNDLNKRREVELRIDEKYRECDEFNRKERELNALLRKMQID